MPFIQILIQKGISGYFCGTTPRLIRYVWLNIVVDAVSLTLAWILVRFFFNFERIRFYEDFKKRVLYVQTFSEHLLPKLICLYTF